MTARGFAVMTVIGRDRVGLVADVASFLEMRSCNIEESRMSILGGEFAGIMLVSGPLDVIRAMADGAEKVEVRDLRVEVRLTSESSARSEGLPYLLESVSLDAPGIVHSVTEALRARGINIENLETETSAAPWTGAPTFRMKAHIVIPKAVAVAELREELSRIEQERDLDIDLRPVRFE